EFASITAAVRCAIEVQRRMLEYDGDLAPDQRIRFRIGINIGDVLPQGTDIHGGGGKVAARLQGICPARGIWVSRAVRDHVPQQLNLSFEELGPVSLKNIARPIEAFVLRIDAAAVKARKSGDVFRRKWLRQIGRIPIVAGLAILAVTASIGWWLAGPAVLSGV